MALKMMAQIGGEIAAAHEIDARSRWCTGWAAC